MKRSAGLLLVTGILFLIIDDASMARGPGGGGRGGGGGGRAGGGMSRPSPAARPSMPSRPSSSAGRTPSIGGGGLNTPSRPSTGAIRTSPAGANLGSGIAGRPGTGGGQPGLGGAGGRPSAGQLNDFLNIPRPSTGAIGGGNLGGATAGRPGAGGAAADFLNQGNRPAQLPAGGVAGLPGAGAPGVGNRPGVGAPGVGNRPGVGDGFRGNLVDHRPNRVENRQQWQDNRQQRRDEVRDQVADNYPRLDFWSQYPNWAAWRINRPYRWATWAVLGSWIGYGAGQPSYYDYGTNVYYQGDQVYQDGQVIASADQYADQAAAIVATAPQTDPASAEWMPLGVFALTQDGQATGADPTLFLQLAVNKEGVIAGTFRNMATNQTQQIEGAVDKTSQRAAWCVVGQQRPIMETGLDNLTKDEAPALIHFADGSTQQWLMVRLNEPPQP